MKLSSKILIVLVSVLVLVVVALWQIFVNLDAIVAHTIRNVGSSTLGTPVTVEDVAINLSEGQVRISGLRIGNPPGFSAENLFEMDDIAVDLDTRTLTDNPLVIEVIVIRQPRVYMEINDTGRSNIEVIKQNLTAASDAEAAASVAGDNTPPGAADHDGKTSDQDSGDEPRKLIIKRFRFEGGQLHAISHSAPEKPIEQTLPSIQMENLGAARGGASPRGIAIEMMTRLVAQISEAAIRAGINKALEKEKDRLIDKANDKIRKLLQK